jgi:hypothetical protein
MTLEIGGITQDSGGAPLVRDYTPVVKVIHKSSKRLQPSAS